MNLLDTIRQNSSTATEPQGQTDQTQQLGTLLRAKSGKAGSAPSVTSSNLGEQQAVTNTNTQLQNQVAPQAAIQNQQLQQQQQGQQAAENQQVSDIAQGRKFDNVQNNLKINQVLSDLGRSNQQIDWNRDKASLEQVGATLRLQNQQYVDNLQREGAKSRLDNESGFKEEAARTAFGNNQDILQKDLANKSVLDASDREFSKALANMNIDSAWTMFNNAQQASAQRQVWTAAGSLATTGIGAYGTYADNQDKKDYYTTGGGAGVNSYEADKARKQ